MALLKTLVSAMALSASTLAAPVNPNPLDPAHIGTNPHPLDPAHIGTNPNPLDPAHIGTNPNPLDPAHIGTNPNPLDPAHIGTNPSPESNPNPLDPAHIGTGPHPQDPAHNGTNPHPLDPGHIGTNPEPLEPTEAGDVAPNVPLGWAEKPRTMVSEFYKIFPQEPEERAVPVPYLHLEAIKNQSYVEQVAVFRGIPAGAKNCQIGFQLASKEDRVFFEYGLEPDAEVSQLKNYRVAEGGDTFLTYNMVDRAPRTGQGLSLKFDGWSHSSYGGEGSRTELNNGGFHPECDEEIVLHMKLMDTVNPDDRREPVVFMMQDELTGIFINYDLE